MLAGLSLGLPSHWTGYSRWVSASHTFSFLLPPTGKHNKAYREVMSYYVQNKTSVWNNEARREMDPDVRNLFFLHTFTGRKRLQLLEIKGYTCIFSTNKILHGIALRDSTVMSVPSDEQSPQHLPVLHSAALCCFHSNQQCSGWGQSAAGVISAQKAGYKVIKPGLLTPSHLTVEG